MDFTHADIASIYAFITELGFKYAAQRYVMLIICFFFFQILPNNDLLISSIDWMKNMGDYFCRCSNEAGVDEQSTFLYPVSITNIITLLFMLSYISKTSYHCFIEYTTITCWFSFWFLNDNPYLT